MDSKSRMATRVQTLMRDLEKLKIAKEALKMNITTRNQMREMTEPAELHDVMKSNKKINKKGEYRTGGKIKKLSANQMKLREENYGPGAIARALRKKYQESGQVDPTQESYIVESGNLQGQIVNFYMLPRDQQERILNEYNQNQNQNILTNPGGYVHPTPFTNNNPLGDPNDTKYTHEDSGIEVTFYQLPKAQQDRMVANKQSQRNPNALQAASTQTGQTTQSASKPTKKELNYNKKVKGFRLMPDGTLVPDAGDIDPVLSYEKDKNGNPVLKTMKGIKSFDPVTGDVEFTQDKAGLLAGNIWEQAGDDPTQFVLDYIKAANDEILQAGKKVSYNDLYKYIKQHPEIAKVLEKSGGYDKKYGPQHEKALGMIDWSDYDLWDEQGQSLTWIDDKTEAVEGEEDDDIDDIDDADDDDADAEEDDADADAADGDADAEAAAGELDYDLGMTKGEKLGLATGAAGRLGGIAAALSNKPQRAFNAFQGASTRAEDSLRDAVRQSRIGIEQTANQIKAQGNLARKVARDTSNSWAQRYAASLGAQRITDEGLIKNRNMWERLYGDMKGKQAQVQLRGDMASAQGAMQVQDWFQRDKDSYLTGLAQEGQNLTNYGASMAGLYNMRQMRNQQLQALADMGVYFGPGVNPSGNISINFQGKKNKKKKKP